jgi:predicted PurR-regulated permease PerM
LSSGSTGRATQTSGQPLENAAEGEAPTRSTAEGSWSDRDFIARSVRVAIIGSVTAAVVLAILWVLKAALTPLAAAFVIAYFFDPIVDRFEVRRVKRSVAVALLVVLMGGGLAALFLFLLPRLQREIMALAERLPGYLERVTTIMIPELEGRFGIELPRTLTQVVERIRAGELPLPFDAILDLLSGSVAYLTGTVTALIGLLVIPILAYYLLVSFDEITTRIGEWIPPRHRGYVIEKARTVDRLISGFLRGQLLVASVLGILYAVGFSVIGIDLAIGIGFLAGVLALVPYLGNVVALGTASVLCVLKFGFDAHLLAVFVWYVLVQNLEGFVLTPRIVGKSVGLHPALVIVALLIGGDLFGFLGLLVAVPLAAVVKVFAEELLAAYRNSSLFARQEAGD